jgi:DNA-binding response OmpR family regulator
MVETRATVLLIDSDPNTQEIIRTFFARHGYAVLSAAGREEGVHLARKASPRVIIAEMYTPSDQIPILLTELRSEPHSSRIPIITLSAHALKEDRTRALAAGANRYLAKPVEPRVVLDAVVELLREHPAT